MIDFPVSFNADDEYVYTDRDGFLFSSRHLNEEETEEIVKRVNLHDELVKSLRDMVEIVGSNFCQNIEIKRKYKIARELLEKLK